MKPKDPCRAMGKQGAGGRFPHGAAELYILSTVAEALNSSADVAQALERTLGLVADFLDLHTGWIWLVDSATGRFYSAAARDLPPYLQEPVRMMGNKCWCIESFQKGQLKPENIDVMECSRLRPAVGASHQTYGLKYHASIPLSFQGKPLGIMNVASPSWRKLSRDELRLLSTIAYEVGIAVERARLAEDAIRMARVEERARIAREIHDTLAQGLTAIALHIESALNIVDSDPHRARDRLQRALATSRESLEEARRSVLQLRALPLDGKSLPDALAALARQFTSETGVRVHVNVAGDRRIPAEMEPELFRIAQEALANVRKHAHAHTVDVRLTLGPREATLTIRDDGKGFQPRSVASHGHGLVGMRERTRLLGGRLRITSREGGGTRVSATVPLPEPAS